MYHLPSHWTLKKLGNIAQIIGGVSYSSEDITTDGVRIIRGGNIQNGRILPKEDDVFLPISYANTENQIRLFDTLIVSSTGSTDALAKAATVFDKTPHTQIGAFLRIIRPLEIKYAMWISMWCTSLYFRDYLVNMARGTSINNIRTEFLLNFEIPIPPDSELNKIATFYQCIATKITLNRHINQNLEA